MFFSGECNVFRLIVYNIWVLSSYHLIIICYIHLNLYTISKIERTKLFLSFVLDRTKIVFITSIFLVQQTDRRSLDSSRDTERDAVWILYICHPPANHACVTCRGFFPLSFSITSMVKNAFSI